MSLDTAEEVIAGATLLSSREWAAFLDAELDVDPSER